MTPQASRRVTGGSLFTLIGSLASTLAAAQPAVGCSLQLTEHRSSRPVLAAPLPARALSIHFVHSVLNTPVEDHYVWRGAAWHLVEERFEGHGYGLPYAAAEGERLLQEGSRSRLLLERRVMPLVIRPLPAQQMRLTLADGRSWLLGDLSTQAIELQALNC